jgi:hypothetical protein
MLFFTEQIDVLGLRSLILSKNNIICVQSFIPIFSGEVVIHEKRHRHREPKGELL